MADIKSSTPFKALVAQTTAVLLTRGLEVEPVAVRDVVNTTAKNVGVDAEEAVHPVSPEIVADAIEAAADDSREDGSAVHAARGRAGCPCSTASTWCCDGSWRTCGASSPTRPYWQWAQGAPSCAVKEAA